MSTTRILKSQLKNQFKKHEEDIGLTIAIPVGIAIGTATVAAPVSVPIAAGCIAVGAIAATIGSATLASKCIYDAVTRKPVKLDILERASDDLQYCQRHKLISQVVSNILSHKHKAKSGSSRALINILKLSSFKSDKRIYEELDVYLRDQYKHDSQTAYNNGKKTFCFVIEAARSVRHKHESEQIQHSRLR